MKKSFKVLILSSLLVFGLNSAINAAEFTCLKFTIHCNGITFHNTACGTSTEAILESANRIADATCN